MIIITAAITFISKPYYFAILAGQGMKTARDRSTDDSVLIDILSRMSRRLRSGRSHAVQSAPRDARDEGLDLLHAERAALQKCLDHHRLPFIQPMLAHEHVAPDHPFPALPDLVHLGRKPVHEILNPVGQVHPLLACTLDGAIESRTITIVELAEREQSLEVVA